MTKALDKLSMQEKTTNIDRSESSLKRAIVLLSGGLDSATVAYHAASKGYEIFALTVNYGQRHSRELESAKMVAGAVGAKKHVVLELPLDLWGGSSLTDANMDVPEGGFTIGKEVPSTYVPARNLIFLSIAGSWAEAKEAEAVFIGANQVDYSGYPDCRKEFLDAFEKALDLGTKTGTQGNPVSIEAPLLHLTKSDIIRFGMDLGVDYALTWSCYKGEKRPCGECDSCILRAKGFSEIGMTDPLLEGSD